MARAVTMSLSRTVSEIKATLAKIPHPCVFNAPTEGFPLEFCNGGWAQKTRMMPLPDGRKV